MTDEARVDPYAKLRELLEAQGFPHEFTHKFVGDNSAEFQAAVQAMEASIPGLQLQSRRESSGGQHVAYTYILRVNAAEEVVFLYEATRRLAGIRIIL
jgi:putative lipoic acid-binding regulatory protein